MDRLKEWAAIAWKYSSVGWRWTAGYVSEYPNAAMWTFITLIVIARFAR